MYLLSIDIYTHICVFIYILMVIFNNIIYYDRYNAAILRLNHEKCQIRSTMMNRNISSLAQYISYRMDSNTQFINYKVTLVYNMCI